MTLFTKTLLTWIITCLGGSIILCFTVNSEPLQPANIIAGTIYATRNALIFSLPGMPIYHTIAYFIGRYSQKKVLNGFIRTTVACLLSFAPTYMFLDKIDKDVLSFIIPYCIAFMLCAIAFDYDPYALVIRKNLNNPWRWLNSRKN